MKYIKSYILLVLTVFALTGCNQYDDLRDDVNDLKDRVTLIEQQVALLNDNLAVVSYILDTQHKTISKVEKSADGTQHIITLSNEEKLTLTIGKPGTIKEPVITVGADKMWYVNGVSTGVAAVGQDGKNGDGFPEFRIENSKWQVRFGGGLWGDVGGSENIAPGSLGDQFFESAKVEGNQFVVTMKMKDGEAAKVYNFPIVEGLTCSVTPNGNTLNRWGYYEFDPAIAGSERKTFLVKVKGENPQVTYPQGWRAELKKMETVDADGNNYQLVVYAPETTQPISRAVVADNTKDVTVQVQKGAFWAMAKIQVGLPRVYTTLLEKYKYGHESFIVGGLEIDYATYGDAKEVKADMTILNGGVFIVSANNVTLTYSSTAQLDNLIIVPNTADIKIKMTLTNQVLYKGTIAFQNVVLNNQTGNAFLKNCAAGSKMVLDKCYLEDRGVVVANTSAQEKLGYVGITNSDIRFNNQGSKLYLVDDMDCDELVFNNNIVYYSKDVPKSDLAYNEAVAGGGINNGHFIQFKVYNAINRILLKLTMNNNTFIDVEPNGSNSTLGLIYTKEVKTIEMASNLYWLNFPATKFASNGTLITKVTMIRGTVAGSIGSGANNYGYTGNSAVSFGVCYNNKPSGLSEMSTATFFDENDPATFNKTTGVFIPKDGYKAYGAQRN